MFDVVNNRYNSFIILIKKMSASLALNLFAVDTPSIFKSGVLFADVICYADGGTTPPAAGVNPVFMMTIVRVDSKMWFINNAVNATGTPVGWDLLSTKHFTLASTAQMVGCISVGNLLWLNARNRFITVRIRNGTDIIQQELLIQPPIVINPDDAKTFEYIACIIQNTIFYRPNTSVLPYPAPGP